MKPEERQSWAWLVKTLDGKKLDEKFEFRIHKLKIKIF